MSCRLNSALILLYLSAFGGSSADPVTVGHLPSYVSKNFYGNTLFRCVISGVMMVALPAAWFKSL